MSVQILTKTLQCSYVKHSEDVDGSWIDWRTSPYPEHSHATSLAALDRQSA